MLANDLLKKKYPNSILEVCFLHLYKFLWVLFFPLVILYFLKRSIKEPSYRHNFLERLGNGPSFTKSAIWIHAVSLGEFRASVPLIRALLKNSERIIITTITPAGREEAQKILSSEINSKKVLILYLPLEYSFAFSLFFRRYQPRFGIILEYELWPVLTSVSAEFGIPLILAQAQYVEKSFNRDKKWPWFRGAILKGFTLILAKSEIHAQRFRWFSKNSVEVMGELRFDQPIEQSHIRHANDFLKLAELKKNGRVSFCFGSTGPGEDEGIISIMRFLSQKAQKSGLPRPFYIYVPRHKKDFLEIKKLIDSTELTLISRSEILDKNLNVKFNFLNKAKEIDGIFGDSLGEINFYFQMADFVFIGNSFNGLGGHNVIEPLALKKPVSVGPSIWGIEYPVVEALDVNIVKKFLAFEDLGKYWWTKVNKQKTVKEKTDSIEIFYVEHSKAVERCMIKLIEHGFL